MVTSSICQGVQELWDRLYRAWFWYTLATARQHSINTDKSLGLRAGCVWITTPLFTPLALV